MIGFDMEIVTKETTVIDIKFKSSLYQYILIPKSEPIMKGF